MFQSLVSCSSWFNSSYMRVVFLGTLKLKNLKTRKRWRLTPFWKDGFLYPHHYHPPSVGWPLAQSTDRSPVFFVFFGSKTRLRSGSRSNGIRAGSWIPKRCKCGSKPVACPPGGQRTHAFFAIPQPWSSIEKQTAQQLNTFRIFRLIIRII